MVNEMEDSKLKKTTIRLCKELAGPFPITISEHAKNLAAFASSPSVQAEYGLYIGDRLTQLYLAAFGFPSLPVVKERQTGVTDWSDAVADALWVLYSQTHTADRNYNHLANMISALPLSFSKIEPQTGCIAEDGDDEPDDDLEIPYFDSPIMSSGVTRGSYWLDAFGGTATDVGKLLVEFATLPATQNTPKTTLWTVVAATANSIYYESRTTSRTASEYFRNPQIYFALLPVVGSAFIRSNSPPASTATSLLQINNSLK
ncbi:UNVERIFIED_CONTAM: hypothetical protein HDU68_004260, partial [Siphonaria sp. JEL0065]